MSKNIGNIVKCIKRLALTAAAVASLSGASAGGDGSPLLNFTPEPNNLNIPEVQFVSGMLQSDVGMSQNGIINQGPGLSIETPFLLLGPGSTQNLIAGTTTFKDVGMTLGGFAALGAPVTVVMGPQTLVVQNLDKGTFELKAADGYTPLLAGTVEDVSISGKKNTGTGSVLGAKVTYQSGIIYDALAAARWTNVGELSWSLLDISPSVNVSDPGPTLNAFKAKMVGQFSSTDVPEPASLGLLTLAGLGLAARRRNRQA